MSLRDRPKCQVSDRKEHLAWVVIRATDKEGKLIESITTCRAHVSIAISQHVDTAARVTVRPVWKGQK